MLGRITLDKEFLITILLLESLGLPIYLLDGYFVMNLEAV
jgi:hypothetical protein